MLENSIKLMIQLDEEIKDLEELINSTQNANEILKLNILKKELILQKIELEQNA